MSTKIKIALAAVLVLASASAALARTGAYDVRPGWSGGGFVPGSQAEENWFERASRPNNH